MPDGLYVAIFPNKELGVTSFVANNSRPEGGYNVLLRDDDAGEFVPVVRVGFQCLRTAIAYAQLIAVVPY